MSIEISTQDEYEAAKEKFERWDEDLKAVLCGTLYPIEMQKLKEAIHKYEENYLEYGQGSIK
jgi:hypothetical protein